MHSRDRRDGHKDHGVQGDPSCANISCTHMPIGNAWEIALPDSLFDVRVTVGDPCYPSPQGTRLSSGVGIQARSVGICVTSVGRSGSRAGAEREQSGSRAGAERELD